MGSYRNEEARRLSRAATDAMWQGRANDAIRLLDQALAMVESEELEEELVVLKAEALLGAGLEGEEIQRLPAIVMRRRSPKLVYSAAYALMGRFSDEPAYDFDRARFYGEIALAAAEEMEPRTPVVKTLYGLGVIYLVESRFRDAIEVMQRALDEMPHIAASEADQIRPFLLPNLGTALILSGRVEEGLPLVLDAMDGLHHPAARADACLDLCFAYMQLAEHEQAKRWGTEAVSLAVEQRQIRNAHYLLGTLAMRCDAIEDAERHFSVVAAMVGEGERLMSILMQIDVSHLLNWRR